jgi:hypothetical protein
VDDKFKKYRKKLQSQTRVTGDDIVTLMGSREGSVPSSAANRTTPFSSILADVMFPLGAVR